MGDGEAGAGGNIFERGNRGGGMLRVLCAVLRSDCGAQKHEHRERQERKVSFARWKPVPMRNYCSPRVGNLSNAAALLTAKKSRAEPVQESGTGPGCNKLHFTLDT